MGDESPKRRRSPIDERYTADNVVESGRQAAAETSRLTLIGAPTDLGSAFRGSGGGPDALRAGGLAAALRRSGWDIADAGNIVARSDRVGAKVGGCTSLNEVAAACRAVRDAASGALAMGRMPLLLGGDHSLAIGSIAAAAAHCARLRRPLFVLWLDAHADFNTAESSPSGYVFGMPVAVVTGEGHPLLLALGLARPMIEIENVALLGVRSVDPLEIVRVRQRGLRVHSMDEIRRQGMAALAMRALTGALREGAHIHVSFDLDVLDPGEVPGVGLPEAGGTTLVETEACLAAVLGTSLVGSFDLMEHNPSGDPSGQTTQRVIALMERALKRS